MTKKKIVIILLIMLVIVLASNFLFLNLGNYYYANGQHHKSIAMYDKVFIKNTISSDILVQTGISQTKLKNYNKAISIFNELETDASGIEKYAKDVYYSKGICYYFTNDYNSCIVYLNKYREFENNKLLLKIICPYLLYSYFIQEMYNECIDTASYFLKDSDGDPAYENSILNFKYDCYFKQKQYDLAWEVNQQIIYNQPNDPSNYLGNYLIYVETKGIEYARNYLLELEKMFPDDDTLKKFLHK